MFDSLSLFVDHLIMAVKSSSRLDAFTGGRRALAAGGAVMHYHPDSNDS